jgi:hypothetical protein
MKNQKSLVPHFRICTLQYPICNVFFKVSLVVWEMSEVSPDGYRNGPGSE